jgi:hypothetical protein
MFYIYMLFFIMILLFLLIYFRPTYPEPDCIFDPDDFE